MPRSWKRSCSLGTIALLLGCVATGPAWAERGFLIAAASETTDGRSDDQTLLLELGSGTSVSFELASSAQIAIFFTASCDVSASDPLTWVDIDILVDGVAAPPTDLPQPFCTSGNAVAGVARDAVIALPAGGHILEVAARLISFDPGESWKVANKSLILVVQETP